MANKLKKVAVFAVAAVLGATVVGAAACADESQFEVVPGGVMLEGNQTYRTYTSVMPSNWNELTYQDNNDTQILYNIVSNFFEYFFTYNWFMLTFCINYFIASFLMPFLILFE